MSKKLFIAEKPSVALEFAKTLKVNASANKKRGYIENDSYIVTWCVGHLVTMSYPEKYDIKYKRWELSTLPFLPDKFLYEIIENARGQYNTVASLLNRKDVDTIYVCTDAGREGEYIYRLVDEMVGVSGKEKKRVWIDSQTEEEILRGIKEAKPLNEYDNLSCAAYLRAKEDYLMGINFSRALTLKYGNLLASLLKEKYISISVGRVMTCVLGMIVNREREIRNFEKTPFYKIRCSFKNDIGKIDTEYKVTQDSYYFNNPDLYKDVGFKTKKNANEFINDIENGIKNNQLNARIFNISKKKEKKAAPLLFNLAELQNSCSKMFKISPDETLKITQELYEKKLVTYPRTDARVLSSAVGKEILKNIKGLSLVAGYKTFIDKIIASETYKNINKTKYVNDKNITDHYAIIPTGSGISNISTLSIMHKKIYDLICKRFLSIFYENAVYEKQVIDVIIKGSINEKDYNEHFIANAKVLVNLGYLEVTGESKNKKESEEDNNEIADIKLKKDDEISFLKALIKEGETTPPKRYNSGAMILAMENAGNLIEDEELRAQIKGSGIGTSATRAEILKKLVTKKYVNLNSKTQIYTPSILGEMVYEVVLRSIKALLNPKLTASWEKGLSLVEKGEVGEREYMKKLSDFVVKMTNGTKNLENTYSLRKAYNSFLVYYK